MGRRNTILSLVLLLQLGGIAWQWTAGSSAEVRKSGPVLAGLDETSVQGLVIQSGGENPEKITLQRSTPDAPWEVLEASGYPADQSKVEGFVRDVVNLEAADVVSNTDRHHVDFKVAEQDYEKRITLLGSEGKPQGDLLLGSAGRGNSTHVRSLNGDTVYAVRNFSPWKAGTRVDAWIDRNYFSADKARLLSVTLTRGSQTLALRRVGPRQWRVEDGRKSEMGESAKISAWLDKATRITIDDVAGPAEEVAQGQPVLTLSLALGTIPAPEAADVAPSPESEVEDSGAAPAEPTPEIWSTPPVTEETLELSVFDKPDEKDRYLVVKNGASWAGESSRWTIEKLLEATAEDLWTAAETHDSER